MKEDKMASRALRRSGQDCIAAGIAALLLATAPTMSAAADEQADHYQKSVELEAALKYGDALAELQRMTGPRADSYMFHLRKGWLLYLLGKNEDAVAAYKTAAAKEADSVEARLGIMMPQLAARRWLDAEKTGLEVLKLDADNYLAGSRLAYTYYNLTRFDMAEKYYASVLKRYPGDIEMRSGYAWSLFKQGKYEQAKAEFRKILDVAPRHAASLEGIGLCP